ncbi:hypothetical protein AB0M46_04550 [Dactylosporangium sp. NPDC051485]|uniref:hypothetical protein n=1 Tax=Dactylosporangium sp. NPDC051485 TaxID=3154846 RepID=UPI00342350F8
MTDPIRMGVHRAEALDSTPDRVPPFVPRDRLPQVEAALRGGGFLLVTGDSMAGKTRLVFEAMRRTLTREARMGWPQRSLRRAGIDPVCCGWMTWSATSARAG